MSRNYVVMTNMSPFEKRLKVDDITNEIIIEETPRPQSQFTPHKKCQYCNSEIILTPIQSSSSSSHSRIIEKSKKKVKVPKSSPFFMKQKFRYQEIKILELETKLGDKKKQLERMSKRIQYLEEKTHKQKREIEKLKNEPNEVFKKCTRYMNLLKEKLIEKFEQKSLDYMNELKRDVYESNININKSINVD